MDPEDSTTVPPAVPAAPQFGTDNINLFPQSPVPAPTVEDLAPKDTTPVPLANAVGSIKTVPAWQVPTLLTQGFRQPTQQELTDQKYGGIGDTLLGFAENTASAATAGASDVLEHKAFGTPTEDIEGRRQALGTAGRLASSLLGFTGLDLATAGLGAGAEAVDAAKVPFGGFLTRALGSKVAAGAASMAAYEAGQQVSEAMIGDAPFNGEATVAQIGLAAILGGTTEGVLGLGEKALPSGVSDAQASLAEVDGIGKRIMRSALKYGGHPDDVIEAALGAAPKAAAAKMPLDEYLQTDGILAGKEAAQRIFDDDQKMMGRNGVTDTWNKDRLVAVKTAINVAGLGPEETLESAQDLASKVSKHLDDAYQDPNAYNFTPHPVMESSESKKAAELWSNLSEKQKAAARAQGFTPPSETETAPQLRPNVVSHTWTAPKAVNQVEAALIKFKSDLTGVESLPEKQRPFAAWQKTHDLQDTLDDLAKWKNHPEMPLSANQQGWIKGIRHDVKDFLANQDIFGEGMNPVWGDTQKAYSDFLQSRGDRNGGVLKDLGVPSNGRRVFSLKKVDKMLQDDAKYFALTGRHTPAYEAFQDMQLKKGDFLDKLQEAYKTIPDRTFNAEKHRADMGTLDAIKQTALDKYGLANAFKKIPGGRSISLGGAWMVSAIARHLGVPAPAMPFVLAAYEAGRMIFRPKATIEAYGKLANIVRDTRGLIKTGSRAAAKALTTVDYTAHAALPAAYYNDVDSYFRTSLLGGKKAASFSDASAQRREELSQYSDPEVLGSKLGKFFDAYPPDTRQAAINAAARHFQVEQQILPPLPPTLGSMKPKPTEADEYDHAALAHAMANPVKTIIDGVKNGNLTAKKLAVIEATSPRLHQEIVSTILDELSQQGADKMGIKAREMVNLLRGQGSIFPQGYAEASQISQGMPQPGLNVQSPGGQNGTGAVAGEAGAKTRKFKSDMATNLRLPMNDKLRPA